MEESRADEEGSQTLNDEEEEAEVAEERLSAITPKPLPLNELHRADGSGFDRILEVELQAAPHPDNDTP